MYRRVLFIAGAALTASAVAPAIAGADAQLPMHKTLQPGYYELTSRTTAISGMGFTPDQIKKIISAKPEVNRECITAADMAKTNWYVNNREPGCTYKDTSAAGRINATSQCANGRTQKISGNYTPTSFTVIAAGGNSKGSMTISMASKRIGACPASSSDDESDEE